MSIRAFLEKLSSSDPAPGGGGSVSALSGALAASLGGNMVSNLTIGKKKNIKMLKRK